VDADTSGGRGGAGASSAHDLVRDARERCELDVIDGAELGPDQFLQEVVDRERPALLLNSNVSSWPAVERWSPWAALLSAPIADLEFRVGHGEFSQRCEVLYLCKRWARRRG
jgi:hypothetical protein